MTGPICGDCEHYNGRNLCRKMRYTEGELDLAICIDFERGNESMNVHIYQGDNYHHCVDCGSTINFGDMVFRGKWGYRCYTCQYYYDKRENMPNIKITAEVNGKQVPLENISTETFEAIKTLEKPKETPVPVARLATVGTCLPDKKLIFKVSEEIKGHEGNYVAIDLKTGNITGYWPGDDDRNCGYGHGYRYRNIKSL